MDWKNLLSGDPFLDALQALAVPVFLVEKAEDGFRMVHLSPALQAATGFDLTATTDRRIDRIFPARMALALAANYDAALSSDDAIHYDEAHRLKTTDTWWRTTLGRAPDSPQGRKRIIGFTTEITDAKAREARLVSDLAGLRVAHGEIQMLAGLTAHDMRAPLANVISLTDIVLEDFRDLGDGKRDMILACRDVAQSSIMAIDGMMQRVVPDPDTDRRAEPVDLAETCAAIAGLVDPTGALDIAYPQDVVECDAVVLHACLRNLLDNAARFAVSRITITLEDRPADDMIEVIVRDDGPGMAPGQDPVARAERYAGSASGGYGLATILRLLKGQGGSLKHAPAQDGTGAVFRVTLPGRVLESPHLLRA